jgi:hypothetical protein
VQKVQEIHMQSHILKQLIKGRVFFLRSDNFQAFLKLTKLEKHQKRVKTKLNSHDSFNISLFFIIIFVSPPLSLSSLSKSVVLTKKKKKKKIDNEEESTLINIR